MIVGALNRRAQTDEEKHIAALICNLLKDRKVQVGKNSIYVKSGVPRGGILSPQIFNMELEELLMKNEPLKEAIKDGKLVAFADDILLIADNVQEAEKLIENG